MNVKIAETSITFKISEEELNLLLTGLALENRIFIGNHDFTMVIDPNPGKHLHNPVGMPLHIVLDPAKSRLTLYATMTEIMKLSDMGKSRDGLSANIDGLDVLLQVDIRKDKREKINK